MTATTCFFDDLPAEKIINGVYLCDSHAMCSACLKPLAHDGYTCCCADAGYAGHDELLWCSFACMESAHPEGDRP